MFLEFYKKERVAKFFLIKESFKNHLNSEEINVDKIIVKKFKDF